MFAGKEGVSRGGKIGGTFTFQVNNNSLDERNSLGVLVCLGCYNRMP